MTETVRTVSVRVILHAIPAGPDFGALLDEDGQGIFFHVDDSPLLVRPEIFDQARMSMRHCLTDVDQPFGVHANQSLLERVGTCAFLHEKKLNFQLEIKRFLVSNHKANLQKSLARKRPAKDRRYSDLSDLSWEQPRDKNRASPLTMRYCVIHPRRGTACRVPRAIKNQKKSPLTNFPAKF